MDVELSRYLLDVANKLSCGDQKLHTLTELLVVMDADGVMQNRTADDVWDAMTALKVFAMATHYARGLETDGVRVFCFNPCAGDPPRMYGGVDVARTPKRALPVLALRRSERLARPFLVVAVGALCVAGSLLLKAWSRQQ
jgi:hypothetical protein